MNTLCVPRALLVGAAVVFSTPLIVHGQTASALLREDDELLPGETINFLNNTTVNHVGGYACSLSTTGTGTISRIWGNASGGPGALMRSEGTFGDYVQTSFESFYGLGDGGELCYGTTSTRISDGTTGLDGVWMDDTPILHEEDPIGSIPGQFSTFSSRPIVTGDGVAQWSAGFTSILGGSTQNRVLFRGAGLTPLIMGGDVLAGVAEPVSMTDSIDFDHRTSRFGTSWIAQVLVDSASTVDGVMVINGSPISVAGSLMREGTAVPMAVGGLPGENWASFDFLGVTESGAFMITGNTDAVASADEFVFITDQIVLRDGAVLDLDGSPVTVAGAIEGAYLNEQGDWAAIWDVETGKANIEVLILNGEIVLAEGDLVDWNGDGTIDANDGNGRLANFSGISTLTLGARIDDSVDLYFTADIDFNGTPSTLDDLEGFFRLHIGECAADTNGDGVVNVDDLVAVIICWGASGVDCPAPGSNADTNGDGVVGVDDLVDVIVGWGTCD